jgi:acetyl esterase/lipase
MSQNLVDRLDPELQGPVKLMMSQPGISFEDIPAARKAMEGTQLKMPLARGVKTRDRVIAGPAGAPEIKIRIYHPEKQTDKLAALLWIHGGGYMFGDLDQDDANCSQLALAGNCVVVSVDYRLAPENPYPAPLADCYAALQWVAANTGELKVDPQRIAIGGGSAGGGLAAGLALLARDRAEVKIIFQFLIYPMLNDCNVIPAGDNRPEAILWTRSANLAGWRAYLGCEPGGEGVACYAAASRATALSGLAPAYIAVGDLDLFVQEDVEYARKLIEAGVPTELHVYPGGCHAFDMMLPEAAISKQFNGDLHRALKRALRGATTGV